MTLTETEWWAVRDLIVRFQRAVPAGWNWDIRHWDGARFHYPELTDAPIVARGIGLWHAEGVLVGAAHSEDGGDAWLELDPDHVGLEPEMIEWAEKQLGSDRVFAWDYDEHRRDVLLALGYTEQPHGMWGRLARPRQAASEEARVTPPYRLATTSAATLPDDAPRMAALLNAAFGRTIHTGADYALFADRSPSFSHELNLVAVAPDGSFAAHVGVTHDVANRHGIFEPVCTHPDHRRHGLAAALIAEGMRRLAALGAETAYVETGDAPAANALYQAVGFREEYRGHWWHSKRAADFSAARVR